MKKILIVLLAMASVSTVVNAQIVRAEELEKYAKTQCGDKWVDAATRLGTQLPLDKNKSITFVQDIEASGKSKAQLYMLLNYWFASTFNSAEQAIKLNDKELGTIIANGFVADIAQHIGGANRYNVSIRPIHKKTSSKALVMAHAYSNVIIDKIEECVKNGLVGNEDDDW